MRNDSARAKSKAQLGCEIRNDQRKTSWCETTKGVPEALRIRCSANINDDDNLGSEFSDSTARERT